MRSRARPPEQSIYLRLSRSVGSIDLSTAWRSCAVRGPSKSRQRARGLELSRPASIFEVEHVVNDAQQCLCCNSRIVGTWSPSCFRQRSLCFTTAGSPPSDGSARTRDAARRSCVRSRPAVPCRPLDPGIGRNSDPLLPAAGSPSATPLHTLDFNALGSFSSATKKSGVADDFSFKLLISFGCSGVAD